MPTPSAGDRKVKQPSRQKGGRGPYLQGESKSASRSGSAIFEERASFMQLTMTEQIAGAPPARWVKGRSSTVPGAVREVDFNWLLLLLAAVVFEGALRKWVLPEVWQAVAYGAKDVLAALFIIQHPLPRVQAAF